MKKILQKLKLNRGATGADIVVALSVLSVAMVVVSIIFVNMQNLNKQVNRTAGATRIATNVMELIKSSVDSKTFTNEGDDSGYEKIEMLVTGETSADSARAKIKNMGRTVSREIVQTNVEGSGVLEIYSGRSITVPKGYTLKLTFTSWVKSGVTYDKDYDIVGRLIIDVSFKVGEQTKHVTLSTGVARGYKIEI